MATNLNTQVTTRNTSEMRAPGMLVVHYEPITSTIICGREQFMRFMDDVQ